MLRGMPRPARLPAAPKASLTEFAVRVLQAPRENARTMARVIKANGGTVPKEMRPRDVARFKVKARSQHQARAEIDKEAAKRGYRVRSVNRGLREFIVYIAHGEDTNATDS